MAALKIAFSFITGDYRSTYAAKMFAEAPDNGADVRSSMGIGTRRLQVLPTPDVRARSAAACRIYTF